MINVCLCIKPLAFNLKSGNKGSGREDDETKIYCSLELGGTKGQMGEGEESLSEMGKGWGSWSRLKVRSEGGGIIERKRRGTSRYSKKKARKKK